MKRLQTFENFKNTLVGSIFSSDFDKSIDRIFQKIKETFDPTNLSGKPDKSGAVIYNLNGTIIEAANIPGPAGPAFNPGYEIKIDGEKINCSFLLGYKICKFLLRKWKIKETERINSDLQKKINIKKI